MPIALLLEHWKSIVFGAGMLTLIVIFGILVFRVHELELQHHNDQIQMSELNSAHTQDVDTINKLNADEKKIEETDAAVNASEQLELFDDEQAHNAIAETHDKTFAPVSIDAAIISLRQSGPHPTNKVH